MPLPRSLPPLSPPSMDGAERLEPGPPLPVRRQLPVLGTLPAGEFHLLLEPLVVEHPLPDDVTEISVGPEDDGCAAVEGEPLPVPNHGAPLRYLGNQIEDDLPLR